MLLQPYRVLDLTDERGEIGPMLMGDIGADVIKVEPPGGTSARRQAPFSDGISLSFCAFNRNKRSIVLDPESVDDRQTLEALIRNSDFIFDSAPDGLLASFGMGFGEARSLNPRIIFVRLSPFGESGPYADMIGSDLTIAAMGGPVALQGVPDRAPVRISVPQVWRQAGTEAAVAAMVAHHRMIRTGEAQYLDLSAQCTMTWTMLNAMDAYAIQGYDFERNGGEFTTGTNKFEMIYACADGHVLALPASKVIIGCLPWMIEEGLADEDLYDTDWEQYDETMRDPEANAFTVNHGVELLRVLFASRKKNDLFEYGLRNGISLAPINTLDELLNLEHMKVRDYWQPLDLPDGRTLQSPGLWSKPSLPAMSVHQQAPAVDEHRIEILEALEEVRDTEYPDTDSALPFEGIVVADFSWVGVGPISTKYLADHGARVIRIESEIRPDVLRAGVPFKDSEPGLDMSQFYGDFNTSKQSLTLDMKNPEAIEIAKKLIARADVMVESFAPGAIDRMGLGYEDVKRINPDIIMVSTCLMGQTGPAAQLAGYGYHAGAIAGFYEVTGWSDLGPSAPWVAYTDTIAPRFVSLLLASAIDHRRRTGEGCYFDVAQIETALHFLGPELLDLQANGAAAGRNGNRSKSMAPQGCYPCSGEDRWCAIAVETDEQWQLLCRVLDRVDLGERESLADHAGRLAAHDEIDAAIAAWTEGREAYDVMQTLQGSGVPAGVVQRSSDLLADPQYEHRGFYRYLDHPAMGNIPYAGHQYQFDGYDNGPRTPAPLLGQHSFEVLSDLLEFGDEEIAAAYESGVVN
ncbi:MAG: CoA transferase [Gammaproteobacteria bacterium]|jgi:crotonobetainyl-CoA:carnitine CoA-transferase CaiB-like acyl-CoA transferase|nr:CoA transferase [Gammaproteobacteria bacterium]MBT4492507.1 CoA transferase [Gammaproteobacteria bacterium]MBT7369868.1 CoA transferase [Gammaproteobacteria bacterium]